MSARSSLSDSRRWPIRRAQRWEVVYFLAVDAVAVVVVARVIAVASLHRHDWGVLALLTVLAVSFEEVVRRAARLQLRISRDLKRDMTSVWAVGAAVGLPPISAVILLSTVLVYTWFRQQRPAGEPLYRKAFSGGTIVLSCLAAGAGAHAVQGPAAGTPWMLGGLIVVVTAIVTNALVNRAVITLAVITMGGRGRALLGTREDNLIEIATLCLGGLLAGAVTYEPWLAVLVVVPMVTLQRGALVRELEVAATTDGKTGLLNAVAWEQVAQREMVRARRESGPLSVLIVDLDRFKSVNDRFGHLAGDAVLERIGRALESTVREYDTVGRFGGEEFVAVLPAADSDIAAGVAERVRARISAMNVGDLVSRVGDAPDLQLSVSIGVADMQPDDEVELLDVLHAADRALYRAKAGGRNQVCVAGRGDAPRTAVDA